ncbi:cyclin-dependent kinase [Musa troglodytarum]|uniref:[RNA-polymerase]-subunit kinase n=1 Tax=Musa troglodytarum TaxID=320322 RepID=A0A9E7HZS5_9LILI|nr:cyclin-dependent kinase [Musa troglodytarum]URE39272.1 cyclin-dependent kinase [Musa troglodytarum]
MAAGRHGGYRDNRLRDRETDVEVSRRKDYYRDGLRDRGPNGDHSRDVRDRISVRQKDIREMGAVNGSYSPPSNNLSGGSSHSQKINHLSGRDVDRETGELSSGSGSDDAEAPISKIRENGTQDKENGDSSMSIKKRKFSPIIWDRDDDKQSAVATYENKYNKFEQVNLPPPPPLPEGFVPPHSIDVVLPCAVNMSPVDVDVDVPADSPQEQLVEPDQEARLVDDHEEELAPARSISFSRWADGNSVLNDDEDKPFEDDLVRKRRKATPLSDLGRQQMQKKTPTPELGEVIVTVNSGGSPCKLSDSEGKYGNTDRELGNDRNDYMDVDVDEYDTDTSDQLSDTDSEGKDDEAKMLGPAKPPQRCINMLQGCRSVDEFERLNKIDEGTYGVVYRAKDKKSREIVALKKVKMEKEREGVKYLHDNWVLHRDLKTSNLLLNNRGELKICDFGLSRQYGSPLKPYTHLVVTLWYRAPELLLGAKEYTTSIDMWSLGCIMAELLAKEPLFSGKTEFDQLDKIFRTLGTPNENIWPGFAKLPGVKVKFAKQPYNKLREKFPPTSFSGRPTLSEAGFDLLNKLLTYDPEKRITAEAALNHRWFQEVPLPKSKDFMPTFPAQHAQDRRQRRIMKSPDPLAEQMMKEVQQEELGCWRLRRQEAHLANLKFVFLILLL